MQRFVPVRPTALVVGVVVLFACEGGIGLHDAAINDGSSDDGHAHDAGPPTQYCADDIVRFVAREPLPDFGPDLAVLSLETFDVVLAAPGTLGLSETPFLVAYTHDRTTGVIELQGELTADLQPWVREINLDLLDDRTVSEGVRGALFVSTNTGIVRLAVWEEGATLRWALDPHPRAVSPMNVERGLVDEGIHVRAYDWPVGEELATRETPLTVREGATIAGLRAVLRSDRGAWVSLAPQIATSPELGVARVVRLDSDLTRVLDSVELVRGVSVDAMQVGPRDELFVLAERTAMPPSVMRVSAGGLVEPWVDFDGVTRVWPQSGALDGEGWLVLGSWSRGRAGLALGRVRLDRAELEGGFRPLVSGVSCGARVATPPSGGAVVASTCFDPFAIDLTYFCNPEVPRD